MLQQLLKTYPRFLYRAVFVGFTRHLVLVCSLVLVAAILFGDLGAAVGAPALFWHEEVWLQMLAGAAVALLMAQHLFIGYLLDTRDQAAHESWTSRLPDGWPTSWVRTLGYYLVGGALPIVLVGAIVKYAAPSVIQQVTRTMTPTPESSEPVQTPAPTTVPTTALTTTTIPSAIPTPNEPAQAAAAAAASVAAAAPTDGQTFEQRANASRSEREQAAVSQEQVITAVPAVSEATVRVWPLWVGMSLGAAAVAGVIFVAARWVVPWICRSPRIMATLPDGPEKDQPLHVVAGLFFLLVLIQYLLGAVTLWGIFGSPPVALCTLLALIAAFYGFVRYRRIAIVYVLAGLALLVWLGGTPPYKFRFDGFGKAGGGSYYDHPVSDYEARARRAANEAGSTAAGDAGAPPLLLASKVEIPRGKRPLVIVCVSGGGIRAAVWAAAVMSELETALPGFAYDVRIVTGASGGMVGASHYVATLLPPGPATYESTATPNEPARWCHDRRPEVLLEEIGSDGLSPVLRAMIFRDLPLNLLPFNNQHDRGKVWEQTWEANTRGSLSKPLNEMYEGEKAGWCPSLIYTPMLVEDGRRLLISNLDLGFLTTSNGAMLDPRLRPYFYSGSAHEWGKMFPESRRQLKLVTAARMVSSFPYITPAGVLPTEPRRRVVDAGYFDNYGVSLAGDWLNSLLSAREREQAEAQEKGKPAKPTWLDRRASGVLIVQIRDNPQDLSAPPRPITNGRKPPSTAGARGVEELTTPPEGLLAARDSVSMFRNDGKLQWLNQRFRQSNLADDFFTTTTFEFTGDASLTWYLTRRERDALTGGAKQVTSETATRQLREWWKAHTTP